VNRVSATGAGGSYLKLAVPGGLRIAATLVTALFARRETPASSEKGMQ
jgi:hypothetical protein